MESYAGGAGQGCTGESGAESATVGPARREKVVKAPFKLIAADGVSTETVDCLRTLLREAEAGKLIGVAYVSMYKRRLWDYRACGEAYRNQTWALGMLQAFAHKMATDINNNGV